MGDALPLLSVVVPTYNAINTLDRAMESLLGQSMGDLEVVVVDDASTDGTQSRLCDYARGESKIRCVFLPKNGGPAIARNVGLSRCRGHWIALLDADDAWLPERAERMLRYAKDCDADVVADNQLLFDSGANRIVRRGFNMVRNKCELDVRRTLRNDLSGGRFVFGWLKPIMRRSLIESNGLRYDESMRYAEDFDFLIRLLLAAKSAVLMREAYYVYTQRLGSVSRERSIVSRTRPDADAARACARRLVERVHCELTASEHRGFTRRELHSQRWEQLQTVRIALRYRKMASALWCARPGAGAWRALATASAVRLRQRIGWI